MNKNKLWESLTKQGFAKAKMNKKGDFGDNLLPWYIVYIIFGIIFFLGLFYFIFWGAGEEGLLEDFYAKEIGRVINSVEPGTTVELDVTKASGLAIKNGKNPNDIFRVDNVRNEVIVSLRSNGGASFSYFNNVDIVDMDLKIVSGSSSTNKLYFRVVEAQRTE